MSTSSISIKDIKRNWHLVDAKNKVLGRIASDIAQLLLGKNKAYYVPYLDSGDNVVVINAADVKLTGKKEQDKTYYSHSMFRGGLRVKTVTGIRQEHPERLLEHAVWGMLPKTKLGRQMFKKLHVFPGNEHPFKTNLAKEGK
ncbi:50S ribosomal protein L13 [Patescibacteria group bacterium]|nr:50S ribosomal protein L13 [Patescibacteria group bacterium]MCL5409353.1 50S ribosomal protein L13 [Patescibacteria group bacterium]